MKIHSHLLKIEKIGKLFEDQRKFVQVHTGEKMTKNLLKMGFLVTLNPKERRKKKDLKLFKNRSGIKII